MPETLLTEDEQADLAATMMRIHGVVNSFGSPWAEEEKWDHMARVCRVIHHTRWCSSEGCSCSAVGPFMERLARRLSLPLQKAHSSAPLAVSR